MSQSFHTFKISIQDSEELLSHFDKQNKVNSKPALEVLKRAALIMALTAWETYVEDVANELFVRKFGVLKGSQIGDFMQTQFDNRLKMFHNPDSLKTKQIFQEFFGVDVTEHWNWNNYNSKQAKTTLNSWLKKRGDAVHRSRTDSQLPHIVKRDELDKCIRFLNELVQATDIALEKLCS